MSIVQYSMQISIRSEYLIFSNKAFISLHCVMTREAVPCMQKLQEKPLLLLSVCLLCTNKSVQLFGFLREWGNKIPVSKAAHTQPNN